MIKPIVSPEWLKENINDPNLVVLDASQQTNIVGTSEFANLTIPSARNIDLKGGFSDKSTDLPNMLPNPEQFEEAARGIGISNSSKIVVYDNLGVYTSPRVWWMFKAMGHEDIAVLNGGLPAWIAKGYTTEVKSPVNHPIGNFTPTYNESMVKSFSCVETNIKNKEYLLVDARSFGRFNGTSPEPRKGLLSGHIPNSVNLPYEMVLENGRFKNKEDLIKTFDKAKVDDRPLIFSCGSGITACILLLASEIIGRKDASVFDGSWTEWAIKTQKNK